MIEININQDLLNSAAYQLVKDVHKHKFEISCALGTIKVNGEAFEIQLKIVDDGNNFINDDRYHCISVNNWDEE